MVIDTAFPDDDVQTLPDGSIPDGVLPASPFADFDDMIAAEDEPKSSATGADEKAGDDNADVAADEGGNLIQAAKDAGLSDEDIESLGDRGIKILLERMNAPKEAEADDLSGLDLPELSANDEGEDAKDEGGDDAAGIQLKLDPDLVDQEIIDQFKQVVDVVNEQSKTISDLRDRLGSQRRAESLDRLDAMFGGVNAPLKKVLGEGTSREMNPQSDGYANRMRVIRSMRAIEQGMKAVGDQPPPANVLFEQALRLSFPDEVAKQEREKIRGQISRRRQSMSGRPGSRAASGSEMTPTERAVANVAAKLAEIRG